MLLALGPHRFDVTYRALVMGILERRPDPSSHDLLAETAKLVAAGADALDLGGVDAGPGSLVTEGEELDRVVPTVQALRARFDVPISVDTSRASVARACFAEGAAVANDRSGFVDPDYLSAAAAAGASVVASCVLGADQVPADGDPVLGVVALLGDRARRAEATGIPNERIVLDAGLDRVSVELQSLELLRSHHRLADLGWPLLLAAPDPGGATVADGQLRANAAHALGIAQGVRMLRSRDVRAGRRVADTMARLLETRGTMRVERLAAGDERVVG